MLGPQRAGHLHLRRRARWREARSHAVELTAPAVPLLDQRLGIVVTRLWGIEKRGRGVPVHEHLAGYHAHVERLGLFEEGIDRLRIDRTEDGGGRRACA